MNLDDCVGERAVSCDTQGWGRGFPCIPGWNGRSQLGALKHGVERGDTVCLCVPLIHFKVCKQKEQLITLLKCHTVFKHLHKMDSLIMWVKL